MFSMSPLEGISIRPSVQHSTQKSSSAQQSNFNPRTPTNTPNKPTLLHQHHHHQNALHHPLHHRHDGPRLRRNHQARAHRPLPLSRHPSVLSGRCRRRARPDLRVPYVKATCNSKRKTRNIPQLTEIFTAESDLESVEAFEKSCASSGTTAQCCTLPVVSCDCSFDARDVNFANDLIGWRCPALPRSLDWEIAEQTEAEAWCWSLRREPSGARVDNISYHFLLSIYESFCDEPFLEYDPRCSRAYPGRKVLDECCRASVFVVERRMKCCSCTS